MNHTVWLSLADLDRTFAGRRPLITKLVTVFEKTYANFPDDLRKLAEAGDERNFAVQLHSLKGASASLGAETLRLRIAEIEAGLKNGETSMQQCIAAIVSFWPDVMHNASTISGELG